MAVTNFIWDTVSDNVMLETDENDAMVVEYTHKPGLYGKLLSQDRGGVTNDYHYDGKHSTRQLTDDGQNVTDTASYSAFGEDVAKTGVTTNPFGFNGAVGYYTNPETVDIYVRARTYEPSTGRWLSKDSLGFVEGVNLYRAYFVPNRSDPSGLLCKDDDVCGLEIGSYLRAIEVIAWDKFKKAPAKQQAAICSIIVDPWHAGVAWDIIELAWEKYKFSDGKCGTGKCGYSKFKVGVDEDGEDKFDTKATVTVDGECHRPAEVNYFLWGVINVVCNFYGYKGHTLKRAIFWMKAHRHLSWNGKGIPGREAWTRAGYTSKYSSPNTQVKGCTPCKKRYEESLWVYFGQKFESPNNKGIGLSEHMIVFEVDSKTAKWFGG